MLEVISSSRTSSVISLAEWSPKMDIIALVYRDSPDCVELRRMDWVKVGSINLDIPATSICFSPNGRTLCIAAVNHVYLYEIENSKLLSSTHFECAITCVHMGEYNGMTITIIAFEDANVSLFCDFHYALSQFAITLPAIGLSFCETSLFVLEEDGMTVLQFDMPFILTQYSLIKHTSEVLSSYWVHFQTIENAKTKLSNLGKRIWEEVSLLTSHADEIARSFISGTDPPELSTEVHRARIHKIMEQEFHEMKVLIAKEIMPSFMGLDKASQQLKAAIAMRPRTGITLEAVGSERQLKDCIVALENLNRLEKCFGALFEYLRDSRTAVLPISNAEFADFLVNFLPGFDLPDLSIKSVPKSSPIFEMEANGNFQLPGRFSSVSGSRCVCVSEKVQLIDFMTKERWEYPVGGHPLAAYAFNNQEIGCFFENSGKASFVVLNSEDDTAREVGLADATIFVISPRRIAFVQSSQLFCSVVDLAPVDDEGEEEDGA